MRIIVFGSTGDLVQRKVLPVFQKLQGDIEIYAIGRRDFSEEVYKDFVCKGRCDLNFKKKLNYRKIDFEVKDFFSDSLDIFDKKNKNFVYISLPPKMIKKVLFGISGFLKRGIEMDILIEKPFGESLEDAKELKKIIEEGGFRENVFLADHYLFKEGVINLRKRDFKKFKILVQETVGFEGRKSYDSVGALKDMVQSHFLNLTFKLLKNPIEEFENFEILKFKKEQYDGYEKELGKKSDTETYVELKLKTEEKEFEFVTGKAFSKSVKYMEIDGERIDLMKDESSYLLLFENFLSGKKECFPTIKEAILSWEIIEKIEKNCD